MNAKREEVYLRSMRHTFAVFKHETSSIFTVYVLKMDNSIPEFHLPATTQT